MGAGALSRPSSVQPEPGTSNSVASMGGSTCAQCQTAFSLFKRKKQCAECGRFLCSSCVVKVARRPSFRQCHTCIDVYKGDFERKDLAILQLRDLKHFLSKNRISTDKCKEKHDLVELILKHYGNEEYRQAQFEHQQYVNILRERREMEDEDSSGTDSVNNSRPSSPEHLANPAATNQVPAGETAAPPSSSQADTADNQQPAAADQQQSAPSHQQSHREDGEEEAAVEAEDITENPEDTAGVPKRRASIADLAQPEDTEGLSIRQLKEILARHFVDYKGCCERWELQDRVQRLWHECRANENKASVAAGSETEDNICRVCMDAMIDCVLLECGHMVACTKCGKRLAECPICRQFVVRAVHVFRS